MASFTAAASGQQTRNNESFNGRSGAHYIQMSLKVVWSHGHEWAQDTIGMSTGYVHWEVEQGAGEERRVEVV